MYKLLTFLVKLVKNNKTVRISIIIYQTFNVPSLTKTGPKQYFFHNQPLNTEPTKQKKLSYIIDRQPFSKYRRYFLVSAITGASVVTSVTTIT
jgi:hypothetical protein